MVAEDQVLFVGKAKQWSEFELARRRGDVTARGRKGENLTPRRPRISRQDAKTQRFGLREENSS
jgi:hypothetical protein